MFDLGMSEMAVLGVVALVVVGPKDLPKLARSVGQIYGKMRALAGDFRGALDQIAREAELEELRAKANAAKNFDPGRAVEKFVTEPESPPPADKSPPTP
ncbi:MAG: Sec-independent protein translocase protein TatB [Sphingomonadales bacterium]